MQTLFKIVLVLKTFTNFHVAFADKLGLVKSKVLYKTRSGLFFWARGGTEDMAEIAVVASGSEYDLSLVDLGANPIILDLGAHIGTFSVYVSKKLRRSKILAFEPDSSNFDLLQKNIRKNKAKNIKTYNMAVASYTGRGFLQTRSLNTDAYYLDKVGKRRPNCKVVSLIDVCKKNNLTRIQLMKIDIEGGEYDLFFDKPTLKFMQQHVKYIYMEYHNVNKIKNSSSIKKCVKNIFNVTQQHNNLFIMENIKI